MTLATSRFSRRDVLKLAGVAACSALLPAPTTAAEPEKTGLGLVMYCCGLRRNQLLKADPKFDLHEPLRLLEHCRELGAGGMQVRLGVLDAAAANSLRQAAEKAGLFIEAIVSVPTQASMVEKFDAEMQTAAAVGALAARTTIIPGRRYEYFDSLEIFREFEARGRKSLELAAPIAEKHRLPLAVENHKDQRDRPRVELLKAISSEFVGACVDTGNSFALLEDPIETVEALAPWAHAVHLKDQAVQMYDEGFLLADIPLGQGCLDLKPMVAILRKAKPKIRFCLELITRDPLQVPVFTDKYWATLADVPATDLVRTLRYVQKGTTDNLQYVTKMTPAEQVAREDANVRESLDYARDVLKI